MREGKKWRMTSSEETEIYVVLAVSIHGRLGVTKLGDQGKESYRVRLAPPENRKNFKVPINLSISQLNWGKSSNGNACYSSTVKKPELLQAITDGLRQIAMSGMLFEEDAPDWVIEHLQVAREFLYNW